MKPVGISVRQEVSQRKIATHRPRTAPNKKEPSGTQRKASPDRPESAAHWRKAGPSVDEAKSLWYDESLNKDFVLASIYSQEGLHIPESPPKEANRNNQEEIGRVSPGSALAQLCHGLVEKHPDLLLTDSLTTDPAPESGPVIAPAESRSSDPPTARSKSALGVKFIDLGSALENENTPANSPLRQSVAFEPPNLQNLHQPSGELTIGTAEHELSKLDTAGITPVVVSEEDKARVASSAQRFFFDMWLADHGKQMGVEGGISASDALNIELLAKLDHSLRQAAFEYEQHLEDMSYSSNAQVSSEQQITYITKITTSAMEVFDRLIQEIGETFPLLKTLKRALLPSIFVRHVGGTIPERDEASVTSAGAAGSSSSVNNGAIATSPADAAHQPLIVERWIHGEESLRHLSSVHEGLTKDFARLNHELQECKELLAEQEAKYQSMVRAQVKTFEDLRESNQERLKYMSDCKMIREELDMVQEQLREATEAKVTAEYKTSNLEFQVKEQLGQIDTLERKISDQSAVMEKFKKELNDLKKERREVKKDLFDVQDKLKHLRHTLIHDRKEVLESFEQTKQKARQACVAFGLMDADEEDNAGNAQAVTDGGDGDGDRTAGAAIAAKPKTTEELKQEEDDLLELEFTDRAWQMGSYVEFTQSMLAEEIRRLTAQETTLQATITKLTQEKEKLIVQHQEHVDGLHTKYKTQLDTEHRSAEAIQHNLRSQLQQKNDEATELHATVHRHEAMIQMLQQHSRRIEIELTNACTLGREQADALLMLQEDHRADLKVLRRDETIRHLTATLDTCQTTLEATTRDLIGKCSSLPSTVTLVVCIVCLTMAICSCRGEEEARTGRIRGARAQTAMGSQIPG